MSDTAGLCFDTAVSDTVYLCLTQLAVSDTGPNFFNSAGDLVK